MRKSLPLLLGLLLSVINLPAAADPQYFACRSCHGDAGTGSAAIHAPPLAGQAASYLARQLRHYRDGTRGAHPQDKWGAQMALMAANLREEQIDQLARFIATMPPWPVATGKHEYDPVAAQVFAACAACHGASGQGQLATNAPRISGMDSVYLARQLRNFRDGIRGSKDQDIYGQQMRAAMTPQLDDATIDRLADYIQAL